MSDPFDPSAVVIGYAELRDWYGVFPNFHDAYITNFEIGLEGHGNMRVRAFRMTKEVDSTGHYVLDKHFAATFTFEGIRTVNLEEFLPGSAILFGLDIHKHKHGVEIELSPTYGLGGRISMERLKVDFERVDYDGAWPPR